jgi:hypothetical protein
MDEKPYQLLEEVRKPLPVKPGSSLYETFPPEQAFRLAQKLELHFTPKHGNWLLPR